MFCSREIDIKQCQNYSKTYVCKKYVRITLPMTMQYTSDVIQTEAHDNNTARKVLNLKSIFSNHSSESKIPPVVSSGVKISLRTYVTPLILVRMLVTWSVRLNNIINCIY